MMEDAKFRARGRGRKIRPGEVFYFETAQLNHSSRIEKPESPASKVRPFICYWASENESAWVEITSEPGMERLFLRRDWRQGGTERWLLDDQFLNDGRSTYSGPNEVFRRAIRDLEATFFPPARLNGEGLAAIREEIRSRGGFWPNDLGET